MAVRKVVATRDTDEKFDWKKTWVAEMLLSGEESVKRAAEIERLQGLTPEVKRRNEIKAGVITIGVGAALMIIISMVMQGIILSGAVSQSVAEILSRLWVAGVLPLFVGIALVVNGMFVSKKGSVQDRDLTHAGTGELDENPKSDFLPPAATTGLGAVPFSVTDETTQHLKESRTYRK